MSKRPEQASLEQLADDQLVTLARSGRTEAAALLAQRYSPMLQREVSRFGAGSCERDDLAQEGFLGLLSAIRTYCPAESSAVFSTYAYACIRNRVVSAVRRLRIRENRESPSEESEGSLVALAADPAALVQQREESERLTAWLSRELSELEYRVLRLHLHAFSYEEIAARLAVSTKTVDNALQRVRRKLSARLQHPPH